jgi:anti-sigma regulatory factor (Ser/Thr protein kinase)
MPRIRVPATIDNLREVAAFVRQSLQDRGVDGETTQSVLLACEELLANVAAYAYPDRPGFMQVDCDLDPQDRTITVTLIDQGIPFNPLAQAPPDLSVPLEKRTAGGLGIHLALAAMDETRYERRDEQNVLTLIRHERPLDPHTPPDSNRTDPP